MHLVGLALVHDLVRESRLVARDLAARISLDAGQDLGLKLAQGLAPDAVSDAQFAEFADMGNRLAATAKVRLEVDVEGSFRWSVMPPSGTLFAEFEARSGPRAFARFRLGGAISG